MLQRALLSWSLVELPTQTNSHITNVLTLLLQRGQFALQILQIQFFFFFFSFKTVSTAWGVTTDVFFFPLIHALSKPVKRFLLKGPTSYSFLQEISLSNKTSNKNWHVKTVVASAGAARTLTLLRLNEMNVMTTKKKVGNSDSAHKAARISQHAPSPPNLFTRPGVAVNTWQTPKSQRCRKLLCQGEHVIHLFSHTCLSFGSFVSLTLCLFALCHFQCQLKLLFLYYSNKVRHCGLVK